MGRLFTELVQLTKFLIEQIKLVHNFAINQFIRSLNELQLDKLWDCDELMTFVVSIKLNSTFPKLRLKSVYFFDFIILF